MYVRTTSMIDPQKPLITPEIIKESKNLLVESVEALDASTHGWWRFPLILIVVGGVISAIALSTKYDPNKFTPVQHDSACHLKGDSIICE
jgi:hypothetical protein